MQIKPYTHRCVVQSGDMAGSKYIEQVTAHEIQYSICGNCNEPLATLEQILVHIYEQLTEQPNE